MSPTATSCDLHFFSSKIMFRYATHNSNNKEQ